MVDFLGSDFLLESETARRLYHDYAAKLPIIDYHCHVSPFEIADKRRFKSITEVWLGGDHYKWRAMRAMGIDEKFITGDADDREKFRAWAKTVPMLIGNPLYHWTHLELRRYFSVTEPLCEESADRIFDKCNEILAQEGMDVNGIIKKSNVSVICTTDDPADSLEAHKRLASEDICFAKVYPAFRPDKAVNIHKKGFTSYLEKLSDVCGFPINTLSDLKKALTTRIDFFNEHGCRVSDHALDLLIYRHMEESQLEEIFTAAKAGSTPTPEETEAFQTHMLLFLAGEYYQRDWAMQIHFGCLRDNSSQMFEKLGPDTGYDCMNTVSNPQKLVAFFDTLEKKGTLPKTILYSLNPLDNESILTVMGSFQTNKGKAGYIQLGSAWWFNDHIWGMEKQLINLASIGVMGTFIGMLTDSRSFLSYTRHEYFRRILCGLVGGWVDSGKYSNDEKSLKAIIEGICYYNCRDYFMFD